ncbi:aldehyde dehydrogenase family protein [Bacillus sp. JJ1521]|uniref:aldehyde dehydrogenase family protein n=1 Tax=Bacillus sp. JJ1521 TaxID=3122957 RepID=UPI002FFE4A48
MKKQLFINGEWLDTKEYTPLFSPFSEELIAQIPIASQEAVDAAIEAANRAKVEWANTPAHERATILEKLSKLLEEKFEESAKIISLEASKPIEQAKTEVARTIQTFKFAAEEAKRIYGETIPLDAAPGGERRVAYTVREPIGIIGAITPFNFPLNLVVHKVGPAIAAGNTIVLKPATQTPLSSLFLAELTQEAGLPPGVLNVVTGRGSVIGDKLVTDERISMITFTGSPSVGIGIRNKAGLKKVTLELGSNAAVIIDQGTDIDKIVSRCITGAYSNQGQVCISLQRIYVHEGLYEEFVTKFVEASNNLKIGDPLDRETDISALISKNDVERALSWIEESKSEGAIVAAGGESEGNILRPTVILEANPQMKVSCQEVFAPIVLINKVSSVADAIDFVNDSRFGLQAGIYTKDVDVALESVDKLHVGGVLINDIPSFRVDHMPYGGVKESGTGREGLKYAIEEMTEMKLVIWNRN